MQLAEKMMGLFDLVVSDRSEYFSNNPDKVPDKKSIPSIVDSYVCINSLLMDIRMIPKRKEKLMYCIKCGQYKTHYKMVPTINWFGHICFTIGTLGLWAIVLVRMTFIKISSILDPWTCSKCDHKEY